MTQAIMESVNVSVDVRDETQVIEDDDNSIHGPTLSKFALEKPIADRVISGTTAPPEDGLSDPDESQGDSEFNQELQTPYPSRAVLKNDPMTDVI